MDRTTKTELFIRLAKEPGMDPNVLHELAQIPREAFLSPALTLQAYRDTPLPIGYHQTISAPSTIARMVSYLEVEPTHEVLEVGTGSGYQTLLLAKLAKAVYSVDIVKHFFTQARKCLLYDFKQFNIFLYHQDGWFGLEKHQPYDRIIVCAALNAIPNPLIRQLKIHGRLLMPYGENQQRLLMIHRTGKESWEQTILDEVRFVPFSHLEDAS